LNRNTSVPRWKTSSQSEDIPSLSSLSLSLSLVYTKQMDHLMAAVQQGVTEFIRAAKSLLALQNLSEEEEDAVREVLWLLVTRFPDEGDDAAD
jgi:hypothetical protein